MNNYRLESQKPFNPDKVQQLLKHVVMEHISDDMPYESQVCAEKAKQLSGIIREKIKEQEYDRYKLLVLVTIGEKLSHGFFTGVHFLWDAERDRFATFHYQNMFLFVVASVFGLYYE